MVEALMSNEAGARVCIHLSKAPSSLGKRYRILARPPLQVGPRRKKYGRSQKSPFSPKNLPVLAFASRVQPSFSSSTIELPSILAESGAYSPHSTRSNTLAHAAVGTLSGFPRQ